MAIAPLEHPGDTETALELMRSELLAFGQELAGHYRTLSTPDVVRALVNIEELSKVVDHLQVIAARAVQEHDIASTGERQAPGSLLARAEQSLTEAQDAGSGKAAGNVGGNAIGNAISNASVNAAGAASVAAVGGVSVGVGRSSDPSVVPEFRNCADYLRARLGISRSEANRRLRLAATILPGMTVCGAVTAAPMSALGDAACSGQVSGRAMSIIHDAVQRVQSFATGVQLESMEHHLTRQAIESDEDILRVLARRWEGVLDQDGQEPTEKVLRARQGVFLKGRRNGLHVLEIGATDEQFEHLVTVMNTATNPRRTPGANETPEDSHHGGHRSDNTTGDTTTDLTRPTCPTRAQDLLDGLVSACRIALSTDGLPAAGGHRPQVMVTISYADLVGELDRAGHAVFGQQISARSIRKLACYADIIPLVLGGQGQILDLGRAQRLFPPHLRRALVARDKGCAFPDCSIPAPWCEAHHITPWAKGGTTSITEGVLLCSRHHHVIHAGNWTIKSTHGIPWFHPPRHLDPHRTPRRNTFWHVEEAVHQQLPHDRQ